MPIDLNSFSGKRIAVVGDMVADQFLDGIISRVSREAPVFILKHQETQTLPGGAANAAANIASLGGTAVPFGFVGADESGRALLDALMDGGVETSGISSLENRRTTTKVRMLAGQSYAPHQQVIRVDYENEGPIPQEQTARLVTAFSGAASSLDGIVVSDYGQGTVTQEVYERALSIAAERNIPIVIDSRYRLEELAGATAATPNREEVEKILGRDFGADDCERLRERLGFQALLVTNGNKGMTLFTGAEPVKMDAIGSPEPVDVTGAGDTVIAAFTLGLASGLSFADAAKIANHAGGIVVMKKRTATVTLEELRASIGAARSAR